MHGLGICKPLCYERGRDRADIRYSRKHILICGNEAVEIGKMSGKHLRGFLPYLPYAESAYKACQSGLLALFYGGNKIFCRLFTHTVESSDGLRLEIIQIRRGIHETAVNKALAHGNAKSLNVHCFAGSKVRNVAQALSRTFRTCTAQRSAVLVTDDR